MLLAALAIGCGKSREGGPVPPAGPVLKIVEENEFWTAYESPSPHALSLAWAGGTLWMADLLTGTFYETSEAAGGLAIVRTLSAKKEPFVQARDLAWDGSNLWSVNWGDLIRHDDGLAPDTWLSEAQIGAPNFHHLKAVAWDGARLWTHNGNLIRLASDPLAPGEGPQVPKIDAIFPGPPSPVSMAFHGTELWVADRKHGFILRLDAASPVPGQALPVLAKYSVVQQPFGIAWSETNLWTYDWITKRVYKVKKLPQSSSDPEDDFLQEGEAFTPAQPPAGDTTWTRAASPYVIQDGFLVPSGVTLSIEPGVRVLVERGDFRVEGRLLAKGTSQEPIVFSHRRWDGEWGNLGFVGSEASDSTVEYVRVQYSDNGVILENATPPIVRCVIRKSGIYGVRVTLGAGEYGPLAILGNHITQVAGDAVKMVLSPQAAIPRIDVRGNEMSYASVTGVIIESEAEDLVLPPETVSVEHNIFEYGYGGAGGGFPGVGRVVYRHNLLRCGLTGGGVQVFHPEAEITHNLIESLFGAGYQLTAARPDLVALRGPAQIQFRFNTVREAGLQSNQGDASVVVEENNLLPSPEAEYWGWGMDAGTGLSAEMRRNWWGTADVGEIRGRIVDDQTNPDYGPLGIEPILTESNGIGFIRGLVVDAGTGRPVSGASIEGAGLLLESNVIGGFFAAVSAGAQALTVSAPGYVPRKVEAPVSSTAITRVTIELVAE